MLSWYVHLVLTKLLLCSGYRHGSFIGVVLILEKPRVQLGNLLFLSLRRRCASHEALGQLVLHFIYIFTIKQVVDKIDKEDTASELVRQTSKHFG